jgi:hydrogenase expression/formation protein HypE
MDKILLAHGSGGRQSQELIQEIIYPIFNNNGGKPLLDGAVVAKGRGRLAVSTDSFVVSPLVFPGGDMGKLAVCGTVNDLLCMGAVPKYLTVGLIIEEGLEITRLKEILISMAKACQEANVAIVTGDTKVVERGSADGLFINTTGIGFVPAKRRLEPKRTEPGDAIIVTGNMGDHGMAILSQREGLSFENPIVSDCAPLYEMMAASLEIEGAIKCMRDPTRGGLATTLNELAQEARLVFDIEEESVPVDATVQASSDMLGLDPLYLANEGKLIVIVKREYATEILAKIKAHPYGVNASIIGSVVSGHNKGQVLLETPLGAKRILPMLEGEHLPRIC